jgi:predicted RNase H-like HicB family nuclease
MEPTEYVCWKDQDHWLGYLKEHPDYWTQGESLEDLRAHLHDLECDLRLLRAQVFC